MLPTRDLIHCMSGVTNVRGICNVILGKLCFQNHSDDSMHVLPTDDLLLSFLLLLFSARSMLLESASGTLG